MPQVPYQGAPSVGPEFAPTPRYEANVSPDMFGANIGNAISQLGKTADNVGNEIFARGQAMQDLYNHSEAQQADATYMQKAGELHANFSSLQGKDAVDGYPKYIQDLSDARKDIGAGLSNSMSQKLYDAGSLSTMGRTVFNGAGHAATQNKAYALSASGARIDAISDRTLSTPADDDAFQDGLSDAEDEVRAQGQLKGLAPEAIDEAVAQNTSALWSQRIKGMVRTQPFQAGKILDQAIKDGDVQGEDIAKLTNIVQQARNTVGARIVSNQVMTGAGNKFGTGEVDIKQAALAIKSNESGGNYSIIGVQTKHGVALGAYGIMSDFLPEFLQQAGMPPMTQGEFLKNQTAQDQLFAIRFGGYMKQTGSFNDAASMWLTGKPLAQAGDVKDALGTNAQTYVTRANVALAHNAPLAAKVDMGRQIANEQAPTDPLFGDYVQQRVEADASSQLRIKRDDDFNNRQSVESGLMGGQDGKLPTTLDELTADPKTADAWNKLEPSVQRRYLGVLAHNAKGDTAWTTENLKTYQGLKGQAQADPAEFIDTDVIGSSLPISAKKELINLQQSLKGKAEGDPRVTRALSMLAPDLQAAGISKTVDKEGYYQFVGALQDSLKDFADEKKKPPALKDVQTIGSRLLQAHTTEGWLWNSKTPMYQVPVPEDESKKIAAEPTWQKLGITPTDQQIQRIYTRKLYQDLYGGSKSQPQPAPGQQRAAGGRKGADQPMTDYSDLISQNYGPQNPALPTTVGNIDEDPDKAQRAIDLSKATGVAPTNIYGDLEEFERQHKAVLASDIVANNPHLSDYVQSNPMAAKISNDDYGQLDATSAAVTKMSLPMRVLRAPEALAGMLFPGDPLKRFTEGGPIGSWLTSDEIKNHPFASAVAAGLGTPVELFFRGMSGAIGTGSDVIQNLGDAVGQHGLGRELATVFETEVMGLSGRHGIHLPEDPLGAARPYLENGREPPPTVLPEFDKFMADRNKDDVDALKDATSEAQASLTRERSPEMFRSFIAQHTDAEIGIGGDAVAGLYGDKVPTADDGLLGWVPGIEDKLAIARATGADVSVPLADWLTHAEPETMQALHDDLRVRPGGITANEVKAASEAKEGLPEGAKVPGEDVLPEEVPSYRAATGLEPLFSIGDRKLELKRIGAGTQTTQFGPEQGFHDFSINDENGNPVGTINLSEAKGGKQLYVEMINGIGGLGPRDFGPALMRDLLRQLKAEFPAAESITGHRVSGAREKAGSFMASSASPVVEVGQVGRSWVSTAA